MNFPANQHLTANKFQHKQPKQQLHKTQPTTTKTCLKNLLTLSSHETHWHI